MKKPLLIVGLIALVAILFFLTPAPTGKRPLKDGLEKTSYAFGVNIGAGLKQAHADFDFGLVRRGLRDAMAGRSLLLTPSEMKAALANRGGTSNQAQPAEKRWHLFDPLKNDRAKASYAFGANLGDQWKKTRIDLLPDAAAQGIQDGISGTGLLLTPDEAQESIVTYSKDRMTRRQEERRRLAEKNKKEGDAFLAQNSKKPNVVTLPCGVQYKVLAQGSGTNPGVDNFVSVKYRSTFIDGKEFENTTTGHGANILGLSSITAGLSEVLQLMKPGARWQVVIPPGDAYGSDGGPGVPPNATLIYDVELVSILPGRPTPQTTND